MGCWNETCLLTNMPICHGDPSVFMILAQSMYRGADHHIYNVHDVYVPAGLPLFGIYDDYGTIEEVEKNAAAEATLGVFKEALKTKHLKLAVPDHDKPKRITGIDSLIHISERGYLEQDAKESFVRGPNGAIGYVHMHREAYDTVIKEMLSRKTYNTSRNLKAEALLDVKDYRKEIAKQIKLHGEDGPLLHLSLSDNLGFIRFFRTGDFFGGMYLLDQLREGALKKDLVDAMIELYVFSAALGYLRKFWSPQCGCGSQCRETKLHDILAQFTRAQWQKDLKEYHEENIEEDPNFDPTAETIFSYRR